MAITNCGYVLVACLWYSSQLVYVRWGSVNSDYFCVMTGVRQGGILSPYLFRFYVRDIVTVITQIMHVYSCNVYGHMINLLCFADDMVLLIAPSWEGLQLLINKLYDLAVALNMSFNTGKTVCMAFFLHLLLVKLN